MPTPNPTPAVARVLAATLLLATVPPLSSAAAAERLAIEDFARAPIIESMQLSPDGQALAYLREYAARTHFCVLDLGEDGRTFRFKVGDVPYNGALMPKEVARFSWASDQRVILTTTVWDRLYGAAAVDRDGKQWRGLSGYEFDRTGRYADPAFEIIHTFDDGSGRVLMLDRRGSGAERLFPHVLEVNTVTGDSKRVLANPGRVTAWLSDHQGVVRIGILRVDDERIAVMYRENEDTVWRELPLPSRGHEKLRPLGFDPHNGNFYVAGFNAEDRWSVFKFDLTDGSLSEPLVSDPVYDTLGDGITPRFAGLPLARPIFSAAQQALIGMTYVTESTRVLWFDSDFAKIQAAVDQARPGRTNLLVNQSRDDNRLLFLSFSDRDPGAYFLLDRAGRSFKPIGSRMDWIKPGDMSPMLAIHYTARDGETIHGYLTVPAGHDPKALPLVVMPHGGPWIRDTWGFNPMVQLLASRGYAVLQMNYRGSRGYGSAFNLAGKQQVGRATQTDIEDATRWAIAAGLADPARIAIFGASYGGYSALFGLGQSPDLYRCGVSLAGVTDWNTILGRKGSDPAYEFARRHWKENIGDPDEDEAFLATISPVNFAEKITAPTLVIQGRDDRTVPPQQARAFIAAMKQADHAPETLFVKNTGHSLATERARIEVFTAVVTFLEQHLGPGVEFRPQR